MRHPTRRVDTELAVIGTGIAGFAAALFARARGLEVAQFGHSGAMAYTTGYLDLLGVEGGRKLADPWSGIAALKAREPEHPLARLAEADLRTALDGFVAALNEGGLGYTAPGDDNLTALLPYGVTKPTLSVPQTMAAGVAALADRTPALIVDFDGLQGFSAKEFATNIAGTWPALTTARLAFPQMEGKQVFPEVMARALETRKTREQLADLLRPLIDGVTHVGLPAILGIHKPDAVRADLEARLGVTLFEIPTIPPGVPGIRLREMFERVLPERGVKLEPNLKVSSVAFQAGGVRLGLGGAMEDLEVHARAVVLATGRFLSGGLGSTRTRVFEKLIGLPLRQPADRDGWFEDAYLAPEGHALNRAGVPVDGQSRPVDAGGRPVDPRLFAAGAILSDQDWVRSRSGAGIAIASAWAAVQAI
ncbi:MAG: glycerol-3-phosphate dehydrogenase subunit GlpB [Paracoccaceae bacterium]